MASQNTPSAVPATSHIYLKIKMDDEKLKFPTDAILVIPEKYKVESTLSEEKKNLNIPKEINLTKLSNKKDLDCISIDCDNMKKLIKLLKDTIYNDNIMNLINHIRLFIKNIVILDIYLSDYLSNVLSSENKKNNYLNNDINIQRIYDIFGILSSNLKKYNKLNKIRKYKVKTPILGSNLYSKLKGEYSNILTYYVTFDQCKPRLDTLITENHEKICKFNTTILTTIYYTINELLIENTVQNTKEIKQVNIQISIPEHGSKTPDEPNMIKATIISINLKNLTFKYKNTSRDGMIETSRFDDLCTQKIDQNCKESIIGPKSIPAKIPLSVCNHTITASRYSSNSGSSYKPGIYNDDGSSLTAVGSTGFNLLSSFLS